MTSRTIRGLFCGVLLVSRCYLYELSIFDARETERDAFSTRIAKTGCEPGQHGQNRVLYPYHLA